MTPPRGGTCRFSANGIERWRSSERYLPAIVEMLDRADRERLGFDLCLYNAGMDPFQHCWVGGLKGITEEILAERERIVFDWCRKRGLPIAFVLAGGYSGGCLDEAGLVALHRLTLSAAAMNEGVLTVNGDSVTLAP